MKFSSVFVLLLLVSISHAQTIIKIENPDAFPRKNDLLRIPREKISFILKKKTE